MPNSHSVYSSHHFYPLLEDISKSSNEYSVNSKPRRAKSLKDASVRDHISNINHLQNFSPTHGRDISFYTYIAPDPNQAKGS